MSKVNDEGVDKLSFLFDVMKRYDHYIATTNFKIGLMLSFIGAIVLGLTIRVMSLDLIQDKCMSLYYLVALLSSLTIILSLTAAINLLRAVFPNTTTTRDKKSLIFYGDVAGCTNGADGYKEKIVESTSDILIEDLSAQTFVLAEIVSEKFRLLKLAVRIIIYGVIPSLLVSLLFLILEGAK